MTNPMQFPDGFVFGGATAAYQVEGETRTHGKGKVPWDDFLAAQGRFSPDPASDFYNKYPVDIDLCQRFGINGIRVSIAWSRIFPNGTGEINPEGVAFYHELFATCNKAGVIPYVTLDHFDTPEAFYQNGGEGFLTRSTIDAFVEYAKFCLPSSPRSSTGLPLTRFPRPPRAALSLATGRTARSIAWTRPSSSCTT